MMGFGGSLNLQFVIQTLASSAGSLPHAVGVHALLIIIFFDQRNLEILSKGILG